MIAQSRNPSEMPTPSPIFAPPSSPPGAAGAVAMTVTLAVVVALSVWTGAVAFGVAELSPLPAPFIVLHHPMSVTDKNRHLVLRSGKTPTYSTLQI